MRWLTICLAITALLVTGCGGDDEEAAPAGGGGGGGETLKISADPKGALKFDKTELTAKAGKVTIEMANPSDVPHAVEIEGNGVEVKGETVGKDGTSTASGDLKAGTYEFYCPVGNHKAQGMEGKLTVE
jgi:plastocyanin